MSTNSPTEPAPDTQAVRGVVSLILRTLQAALAGIARDDWVRLADVARIVELLERGTPDLERVYVAAARATLKQQPPPSAPAPAAPCTLASMPESDSADSDGRRAMRNDPFSRLLVRPFELLFNETPPRFSRKFLPAYFAAVRQLIGVRFATHDRDCRVIIQSLLQEHGANLNWDIVYADPRTIALMRRAIGDLARPTHGPHGEERWMSLMLQPAADGTRPTREQAATVRDMILTFLAVLNAQE